MYAVIETGSKQYRVEVGTELEVELLDVEPGQTITLDRVLLVADGAEAAIGRPVVTDAAVTAEVVRQARGEKLIAFKYRPKARRRVKKGHRQELTVLRIADIQFGGKSAADTVRKAEAQAKTERQRLEEAAARQAAEDAALAAKLAKPAVPTAGAKSEEKAGVRIDAKTAVQSVGKPEPKAAAKPKSGRADTTEAAARPRAGKTTTTGNPSAAKPSTASPKPPAKAVEPDTKKAAAPKRPRPKKVE